MSSNDAFTILELILVMCVLAVAMTIVLPSLKGFFRGRNLESEGQRFLALTRVGQSRAISQGVPMILWMDPQQRAYGLQVQAGYGANDSKPEQFVLDESLQLQPQLAPVGLMTQSNLWTQVRKASIRPEIRFLPDGSISESSPNKVLITQDRDTLVVAETTNHLRYEIQH
jgi:type II secretion system protein H